MLERPGIIIWLALILVNLTFKGCSSEAIDGSYREASGMISCFEAPFESLEIPGRGILMVYKGHRLIPVRIPPEAEFCDAPRGALEAEGNIWDNFNLVPKDHEEFSELINDAKAASEKDEEIISALNGLLTKTEGANSEQKAGTDLHVVNEPVITPVHAFPLYDKSHPHAELEVNKKNDEISDLEDSLLLDEWNESKDDEGDGIRMRILMFTEFSRDYLARKGLPLAIRNEDMYSQENFEFFRLNWPSREAGLVIEKLPYSIWKVFLGSGILTSRTDSGLSEDRRKMLVLESLNDFLNGLERYYMQIMDSGLDYTYYQHLSGLGIDKALETIRYYRESQEPQTSRENNGQNSSAVFNEYSQSQRQGSSESSVSSVSTSSLEVPETSAESSASKSDSPGGGSVAYFEYSPDEASQKVVKEGSPAREKDQLGVFAQLRMRWFGIFASDYLARLGVNFKVSQDSLSRPSTIEFFQTEFGASHGLPKVIWDIFTESSFGDQFQGSLTIQEQMEMANEIWVMFNKIESGVFKGNVGADSYLLNRDMLDVEIREVMRQYWDESMDETADKLINLIQRRGDGHVSSEIVPVQEDELIRNKIKAKEMGVFNVESSVTGSEGLEVEQTVGGLESSVASDSSASEQSEGSAREKSKRRKSKKRKSKKGKGGKRKGRKEKGAGKNKAERQLGILDKTKELLESFRKKPEDSAGEHPKEETPSKDILSESSSVELESGDDSPLNWLKFESPMKQSEESEFYERFGNGDPSEKMEGSQGLEVPREDSFTPQAKANEPSLHDVSASLDQEAPREERSEVFDWQPPEEQSTERSSGTLVNVDLLNDLPFADASTNSEYSARVNGDLAGESSGSPRAYEAVSGGGEASNLEKAEESNIERSASGHEVAGASESVGSTQSQNREEGGGAEYVSLAEASEGGGDLAPSLPREDAEGEDEERPREESVEVSGKEKPLQKKFTKQFENKLSSLLQKTKKLFGLGRKSSKDKETDSQDQDGDLDVEEENENLTNLVIYFIQTYAALRYKFVEEGVIDKSFGEIAAIVRTSVHFHPGTVEFDNIDMEKGIKKIASMLGGGSFTAMKSIGLTAKDITASLKKYLFRLCPPDRTEEEYSKNKRLNTTHFWLKQCFTQSLVKEGMVPEQLERPSIVESSQSLVEDLTDRRPIENRAEAICKKVQTILDRFFDKSLTDGIKAKDLDCLAVVAVNELYGFSLSNSLYLFLFGYSTKYWRFLSPDISISISHILESE
ncbi:putative signal peptide-containing secreted protein [Cryptosporidium canis]|uniref:Signal peptide-containing secreted protein n=1 Tax=Cryptosporidium canis TaxID=195482 RepID=A0A9D5HX54_9CRYT|nr:putative signal peptide-containing secreted protein [Cryptosporidium canis]